MRQLRPFLLTAILAVMALALPDGAAAEVATIGSPLAGTIKAFGMCSPLCTSVNATLAESGAHAAAPFSGTIVRWRVEEAHGTFKLRVLRPDGSGNYVAMGSSAPQTPTGTGVETFAAAVPIQAGDLIGIDNSSNTDEIGFVYPLAPSGSDWALFYPQLAEGANSSTSTEHHLYPEQELAFNADVETPPPPPPPAAAAPAPTCRVPNLSGKKLKAAKKKLKATDCKLGKVTKKNGATANTGKVVKQSPKAGKVLAAGSAVKVTLKAG